MEPSTDEPNEYETNLELYKKGKKYHLFGLILLIAT